MEAFEEAAGGGECTHAIVKRKRSKRQRALVPLPSLPAAAASSSLSSSPEPSITEEEVDMASCLILLARGHALDAGPKPEDGGERFAGRRLPDVYECKTCSKCFPSFQALGGHRASHKKPKTAGIAPAGDEEDVVQIRTSSLSKPIVLPATAACAKAKVHECSICGAEFSSGQALGGHMRRHRPLTVPEAKKEHNFLSLDLNLPAPSDDEAFAFSDKRPLLFSSSALVDCHY